MDLEQEREELQDKIDVLEHELDTCEELSPIAERQVFVMRELLGILDERIAECEDC